MSLLLSLLAKIEIKLQTASPGDRASATEVKFRVCAP